MPVNGKARPTMRDVARVAGVSLKSVSRVVNNEPRVSEDLRRKVQQAVDELEYRHNFAASNLRRKVGRAQVVGALLQDIANSFSSSLLRALEDAFREQGIALLAASLDEEPDRERLLVSDLVSRRVDGLVIMPATERQDYLESERRAGLPTVFVDREPRGIDADSVAVDNARGAYMAIKHLVAHGHRRIAVLSDLVTIQTAALRLDGVRRALEEEGLSLEPRLLRADLRTAEAAEVAVSQMLRGRDRPTAVLALRNILSVGTFRAIRATGFDDRVAVVGFDDFPMADLLNVTVIRQNVPRIGALAAGLLMSRLDGDDSPPQHILVEPSLVQRGSGEVSP